MSNPLVVLDPGHGGTRIVGGSSPNNATGPTGLLEKDLTLDVALRVRALLQACGMTVVMTRTSDTNVALIDRAGFASSNGADVFVSIHFNGDASPATNGSETFLWNPRLHAQARSVDLARSVQGELVSALGLRNRGVKTTPSGAGLRGFVVLDPAHHQPGTSCCLAEVSFLSNPAEEARLRTAAYKDQVARAIATGISGFIGVSCPWPQVQPPQGVAQPQGGGEVALSRETQDLWHEVPMVPQQTGMSCWAAAAAMIVGWRDRLHVEPLEVARAAGRFSEYREGLQPHDVPALARTWGLTLATASIRGPGDLARLLSDNGPLWVGEASPGLHSVVVTGLHGDGTPAGTQVRIADPWPIEKGERYSVPFTDFQRNLSAAEAEGGGTQILHAGGRGQGARSEVRVRESFQARFGQPHPDAYPV